MTVGEVKTLDDWDAFEGERWRDAVRERGLRFGLLSQDEQWMVERAETRSRAAIVAGAT